MCTRVDGKKISDTYIKYRVEQEVNSDDIRFLKILSDSARIRYTFRDGKMYARSV